MGQPRGGECEYRGIEVFPELRRAYDEGLIDPQCVGRTELDDVEAMPPGEMIRKTRERHPPIDDVGAVTAWCPYRAPPKVGRNEPCRAQSPSAVSRRAFGRSRRVSVTPNAARLKNRIVRTD